MTLDRRAEYVLLALVMAVVAGVSWHFASQSYFIADDLPIFYDAQVDGGLDFGFLGREVIVHFSPGLRLVTLLIQRHATFDFDVALGFVVACHLVGVALMARILRFWAGPGWSLGLALAYGISIIFMSALLWFSLGVQTLPPIAFALAAIHAHLCWRRTRRPGWLAWSVVALLGALAFYEKAVLLPVYLVLISLLLLEPEHSLRERANAVVRDWRVWALYALPVLAYLALYATRDHYESWHTVPFDQTVEYLRIAWLDGFVPGLFAVRVTPTSGALVHTWAVVGCQIAFLGLVAASVYRRPSAWRSWLFLAIVFLVNALIVLPRVSTLGTGIGYVLRYNVEVVSLAMIAVVSAFSGPRAERARRLAAGARAARALAGAGLLVLAGYVALALNADADIARGWDGRYSRTWFGNVHRDLAAIQRSGARPVLLDDQMPPRILPFWIRKGGNRLSATLPLSVDGLRFDEISDETYRVGRDGRVAPVRFTPTETLPRPRCLTAAPGWRRVEVRPRRTLQGPRWYLRSRYRTTGPGGIFLSVNRGLGYPAGADRGLPGRPAGGTALTELGTEVAGTPTFVSLRIEAPPGTGVCVERMVVGHYRRAL